MMRNINYCGYKFVDFKELEGKTILGIEFYEDEIRFNTDQGEYCMLHFQDCCENVRVKEVDGELQDLIGQKILSASVESSGPPEVQYESYTWTFYHIRTLKDSINISWLGESNGYYSEEVSFIKIKE